MDINSLIGAPVAGALPEEIAPIVRELIEGRIVQMVVIAECVDGNIMSSFPTLDREACNRFAMLGAFDVVKRDFMRAHIEACIRYVQDEDEEG